MIILFLIILALVANIATFILYTRCYRREIKWRDQCIEALEVTIRNNYRRIDELERRCQLRQRPQRQIKLLPGPCFEDIALRRGNLEQRCRVFWN